MNVDIFVKTWSRDLPWLGYLLRSIAKRAKGFRRIVLVDDNDGGAVSRLGDRHAPDFDWLVLPAPPCPVEILRGQRSGYSWQQACKLAWPEFTDADAVVILDSDMILTAELSPATFHLDGQPMWWFRTWEEAGTGTVHKPAVDLFLERDTHHDFMPGACWYVTRAAALGFRAFMLARHVTNPWGYVCDENRPISEFNMLGGWIYYEGGEDVAGYRFVTPWDARVPRPWPIRQFWSWGGIDPVRAELERLLGDER